MGEENIDFNKIDEARKILGLSEKATLKEIKNAYREKAKRYHPDFVRNESKEECDDVMKTVNNAYETLIDYCENYVYPLKKESVEKGNKGYESYVDGFEDDWLLARRQAKQTKNKTIK